MSGDERHVAAHDGAAQRTLVWVEKTAIEGTVDMVKLRIGRGEIEHAPVLPVSLRAEGRTRTTVAISPSVAASRPNRSFSTSLTGFPYRKAGRRP